MKPAEQLRRVIDARAKAKPAESQAGPDEFAKAIARRLQARGIVNVPGLIVDAPAPEETWIDRAVEYSRRTADLEGDWAGQRDAAQHAPVRPPHTAAGILHAAITTASPSVVPLNGAGVLRAALSGLGSAGTINGVDAEAIQGRNE